MPPNFDRLAMIPSDDVNGVSVTAAHAAAAAAVR